MNKTFLPALHVSVTLGWLMVALCFIFLHAPPDATRGEVQRVFYIDVASAWTAMLTYFLIFPGSGACLWKRRDVAGDFGRGSATRSS
jgi:heme exporter protein C